MQVEEIIEKATALCCKYAATEVVLFGSRAKGTACERSDIDLAVSGVTDFEALREALDDFPTLYKVDVLNLDTCGNTLLLEDIRKYGKKIYEKISVL